MKLTWLSLGCLCMTLDVLLEIYCKYSVFVIIISYNGNETYLLNLLEYMSKLENVYLNNKLFIKRIDF